MHVEDGARVVLNRNVFAGFGPTPIKGLTDADREPVRTANVIVPSDRSTR
jgi:precorrin-6B methylase 1